MKFFYNIGIALFSLILRLLSPFNLKASQLYLGRLKSIELLRHGSFPKGAIWIHCASLGEFEQGRPLIEQIKARNPDEKIVLTFFSPSGYEIRKTYGLADVILYLPADTCKNAELLIASLEPKMAIFIKYEFWYHFIAQLYKSQIPLYLASAIFRKDQIFFKSHGGWFREILKKVTYFFCQDEDSVKLLNSIGIIQCCVAGDTRFDRVFEIANSAKSIPNIDKFIGENKVLIAGSSWYPDEKIIVEFIKANPSIKLIIAPHEIDDDHLRLIKELLIDQYVLYSEQNILDWKQAQVLLVDTVGLLSSLYQYGTIAYIGGGFGKGIHNTLEAATFGLPIVFGPRYHKFKEAKDLIRLKAAFSVNSYADAEALFSKLLNNPDTYKTASDESRSYVSSKIGATKLILNSIAIN